MKRTAVRRDTGELSGFTPLQYACVKKDVNAVRCFLDSGASVDALNVYGETALHYAAKSGNQEMVELLLQHKADPNIQSVSAKVSPLHEACLFGHPDTIIMLVKHGANPYLMNDKGLGALALCKNEAAASALQSADDEFYQPAVAGRQAFSHEQKYDSAEICAFSPLMYAAVKGDHVAARRLLLDPENHDQINKQSAYGDTPLHLAFQAGSTEVARALLEHKADISLRNKRNQTACDQAIRRGYKSMIQELSSEFGINFI
jgi:ankyrin repeat protein